MATAARTTAAWIPRRGLDGGKRRTFVSTRNTVTTLTAAPKTSRQKAAVVLGSLKNDQDGKFGIAHRLFGTPYMPRQDERPFLERLQTQTQDDIQVKVSVPGSKESRRFFGRPLARQGIQPVWVEISNGGDVALFFDQIGLDPNYFPPLEASWICHYKVLKRLGEFGLLAWLFLPLIGFLPLKLISADKANRRMDDFFSKHGFPLAPVGAGQTAKGFVFTTLDEGTKIVSIDLISPVAREKKRFVFQVPVPDIKLDYGEGPDVTQFYSPETMVQCNDPKTLRDELEKQPRATTDQRGRDEGDPVNLVVVGDFETVLCAFGSRWDETEPISLETCWKTAKSFLLGEQYRYSPVSPLYLYGRSQDFALQRARGTINERLHLRLWQSPMVFEKRPVWVGQISRDIGVRLTRRTITTHKIDPMVDEARDYVVADLLHWGRVDQMGYVGGVGVSSEDDPRRNLTGDPYVTNGKRAVIVVSPTKTDPKLLNW